MNVYDLQVFHYIVSHHGIRDGGKAMPEPISEQSAGEHLRRLERDYRQPLCTRRPFSVLPAGADVYERGRPFFEWVDEIARRGRTTSAPPNPIRIAASDFVLTEFLPTVLREVRERHPALRFASVSLTEAERKEQLQSGEIHLVIGTPDTLPPGCERLPLVERPLVLVVREDSPITSAQQCLRAKFKPALICPDADTSVGRIFRAENARRGNEWLPAIVAHSITSIDRHVLRGNGVGVTVDIAPRQRPELRVLPLKGFAPVKMVAAWNRPLTAMLKPLLDLVEAHVRRMWP